MPFSDNFFAKHMFVVLQPLPINFFICSRCYGLQIHLIGMEMLMSIGQGLPWRSKALTAVSTFVPAAAMGMGQGFSYGLGQNLAHVCVIKKSSCWLLFKSYWSGEATMGSCYSIQSKIIYKRKIQRTPVLEVKWPYPFRTQLPIVNILLLYYTILG